MTDDVVTISYCLLWIVVFACGLALEYALRSILDYRDAIAGREGARIPIGTRAPKFEAVLTNGVVVTEKALRQHTLVFLGVGHVAREKLYTWIGYIVGRTKGPLCVVCQGTVNKCHEMLGPWDQWNNMVRIAVDEQGSVAAAFGIKRTPSAVSVDAHGRIRTYGFRRDLEENR